MELNLNILQLFFSVYMAAVCSMAMVLFFPLLYESGHWSVSCNGWSRCCHFIGETVHRGFRGPHGRLVVLEPYLPTFYLFMRNSWLFVFWCDGSVLNSFLVKCGHRFLQTYRPFFDVSSVITSYVMNWVTANCD